MAGKGRTGSPNKPKAALDAMLKRRCGADYDAVCELADMSEELRGNDDRMSERIQCLKEVARYTRPALQAIAHTGDISSAITIDITPQALAAAVASMKASLDE